MDPRLFLADLEAKPASLRALASILDGGDVWPDLAGVRQVVLLGMGSSRFAADVAARRMRAAGVPAVAEYASAAPGSPGGAVAVAISATGNSAETLDAAAAYQGEGRLIVVTNEPTSPLAAMAGGPGGRAVVSMHAGVEVGGVACRTFQHTLVLLTDLVDRLAGLPSTAAQAARRAADATEDLLSCRDAWLPRTVEQLDGPHGLYAIAPAERLSSALQSALMVREGPRRAATGCETGDWAHIDVYLTKTLDYRALLFPGSRYDEQAMEWLLARESTVVAVGSGVGGVDVDGATSTIRYHGDDDATTRLLTEPLIAELVAATWWAAASDVSLPADPPSAARAR